MPQASKPPRFYVSPEETGGAAFSPATEILLPATEAHHAAHVLRLREGDAVELFDGLGGSAVGRISRIGRRETTVTVDELRPAAPRPQPVIHLAFAMPKGARLDWLIEKATELGAASLRPVLFERSAVRADELSPAKRAKWLGHCIAAAKQSGLNFLPVLSEPADLASAAARAQPGLYGDLAADSQPLAEAIARLAGSKAVTILVGPEGGITDGERETLRAAGLVAVHLGHTTLRIETAAIALVAATLALLR